MPISQSPARGWDPHVSNIEWLCAEGRLYARRWGEAGWDWALGLEFHETPERIALWTALKLLA